MKYIIQDWIGTIKFNNKVFNCPIKANDFLLQQFPKDEDLQEFYIKELNNK